MAFVSNAVETVRQGNPFVVCYKHWNPPGETLLIQSKILNCFPKILCPERKNMDSFCADLSYVGREMIKRKGERVEESEHFFNLKIINELELSFFKKSIPRTKHFQCVRNNSWPSFDTYCYPRTLWENRPMLTQLILATLCGKYTCKGFIPILQLSKET